mgnify:FL=1
MSEWSLRDIAKGLRSVTFTPREDKPGYFMVPMSGEALTALCYEAAAALESVAERFRERRDPKNDRRRAHDV